MKKIYQKLNDFCGKKWFPLLFVPIAACFLLLYSFSTSPLFLNEGMDSAVFKTMGLAILKGKVPYVDIFDHKGPILYFINALGQRLISGDLGILILQVIGLSVALVFLFKTARLFVNDALSFLAVMISLYLFGGVIQEGDQCEEWMMYFFSVALYYAVSYFVNESDNPHPLKYSILYGFCFGMAFFIRPNDAVALFGGIQMGLFIWLVYKKAYRNAVFNVLCFGVGFLLVAIPVFSYFAYYHAVDDMIYGLLVFNKTYSGGASSLLKSVIVGHKYAMALVLFSLALLIWSIEKRQILVLLLPIMLLEWVLMGTNLFPHYYIVMIPLYLIYITLAFMKLSNKQQKQFPILSLAILLMVPCGSGLASLNVFKRHVSYFMHGENYQRISNFYDETDALLSNIPDDEMDSIWNYNLRWTGGDLGNCSAFSVLWRRGIVQCNLITAGTDEVLLKKDDISAKKPLWVLVDFKGEIDVGSTVIASDYELVAQTDTSICIINLYHRK